MFIKKGRMVARLVAMPPLVKGQPSVGDAVLHTTSNNDIDNLFPKTKQPAKPIAQCKTCGVVYKHSQLRISQLLKAVSLPLLWQCGGILPHH